jgi:hypothetical protein
VYRFRDATLIAEKKEDFVARSRTYIGNWSEQTIWLDTLIIPRSFSDRELGPFTTGVLWLIANDYSFYRHNVLDERTAGGVFGRALNPGFGHQSAFERAPEPPYTAAKAICFELDPENI